MVAIGFTLNSDGLVDHNPVLARVLNVGKQDLFLSNPDGARTFVMPQSRCRKVVESELSREAAVLVPCIGDLVMSITERYGKTPDKKVGVLTEIVEVPGKYTMSKLLQGEKVESVLFDSLMVLEK